MNTHLKNVLGMTLVVVLFMFGFSAWKFVDTYDSSTEPTSFRSFNVSGEGEVVGIPDVAQFSFSVITEGGSDIAALQKKNTEKMNASINFVKGKKVDEKDIKTTGYNMNPRYEACNFSFGKCPPPKIVGYTITQRVVVKVRDFDKIGDILTGIVKTGVNDVSQLSFAIDDPSSLETEARGKAIQEAKKKAKELAKAGGFTVGRLLGIEEVGGAQPYFRNDFAFAESKAVSAGVPSPIIAPGSQEVKANVRLTFEIK